MAEVIVAGSKEIEIDLRDYPAKAQRAFVRAANRSINSARSVIVKAMAGDTGMKQKDIRDALRMHQATMARPEARIGATLRRISLYKFGARGPIPSRGRGRGVTYRNPGGGNNRIEDAFIAHTKVQQDGTGGESLAVFKRAAGAGRLPIKKLFGPSLGQVFKKFLPLGIAKLHEVFEKNFGHELKFEGSSSTVGSDAGTD